MKPSWKKTGRTVFHTAMQPLVMLILLQAAILLVSLYLSGIFSQVNSNERSILGKQVVNRANYLEIQMTQQWSDIAELAQSINRKTQAAIEQGAIRLDLLENDSKEASKLIGMICTDMIETMYRNKNFGHLRDFQYVEPGWQCGAEDGFPRARLRPEGQRDDAV